jgi:murein DD-endopeptidase MepM/ murein hydrolase activator NlpD
MKTPINGARLSSAYGMRKHPILGYNRLHQGVDFAAPTGTPIMAAGTGRIEVIGTNGGAGKYIRIKHLNGYKTAYAHLNAYASGMSKGVKVRQGQTIGFVGSTGLSTGPHLHYEVWFNNKKINPMTMRLPSGIKLNDSQLEKFKEVKKRIDLEITNETNL